MSTMMASTRRTWIQLPRVEPLTMPSSQMTNRIMVIVQSICFLLKFARGRLLGVYCSGSIPSGAAYHVVRCEVLRRGCQSRWKCQVSTGCLRRKDCEACFEDCDSRGAGLKQPHGGTRDA